MDASRADTIVKTSIADPDRYGMFLVVLDPDPSIIKQKQ
jgi:hypothetical protein